MGRLWGYDMWGIRVTFWGILFTLSILCSIQVQAQRAFIFDWDGTVVEDRADLGGNHDTTYRLFRINYRGTTFQPDIVGPNEIDISHADWEKLTTPTYDPITKHPKYPLMLARGEGQLGSIASYTLSDGRVFVPGYYRIINPDTFVKYSESRTGENYFEKSFAEAFEKTKRGEGRIQGDAFEAFYRLVNNPETRKAVYVISARGHSFSEVLEKLKNDRDVRGLIRSDVSNADLESLAKRHIMMMRPEYQHFDNDMNHGSIKKLKANVILEIATGLVNVNPSRYVEMLDSAGEKQIKGVEIVYYEDRYEYLETVVTEIKDLVHRKKFLKFTVHNMGREEDVRLSERPRSYVLTPYSSERLLTAEELIQMDRISALPVSGGVSCKGYFGGVL